MENQNFLQRPGGLGPMPPLKPLGMAMASPASYMNDDISISARRAQYTDDVNRVFAQYNIDMGTYARSPVNPLPLDRDWETHDSHRLCTVLDEQKY